MTKVMRLVHICDECGTQRRLSPKDRRSASKARCYKCGSTRLIPTESAMASIGLARAVRSGYRDSEGANTLLDRVWQDIADAENRFVKPIRVGYRTATYATYVPKDQYEGNR